MVNPELSGLLELDSTTDSMGDHTSTSDCAPNAGGVDGGEWAKGLIMD